MAAKPQKETRRKMSEPIENYIPVSLHDAMRRQAWRVWAVGLFVVFVWAFLIVLDPLAKAYGFASLGSSLDSFYHFICHRIPERSFHVAGEQFGVCTRCSGVYFGLFFGFLIYPLWRRIEEVEPLARFWLFLSMIPIGVDWSLTIFGIWENTQLSRVTTGLILGIACATYIVPAIVEIARNISYRRSRSMQG